VLSPLDRAAGVSELRAAYAVFEQCLFLVETLAMARGDVAYGARDLVGVGTRDDATAALAAHLAVGPRQRPRAPSMLNPRGNAGVSAAYSPHTREQRCGALSPLNR
jgi:hypothetical protein